VRAPQFVRIGLFALSAVACGHDCTLIGCVNGLTIQFASTPTAPYHIEATSPDAGLRSIDCATSNGCLGKLTQTDYVPGTVTLTMTYQGRTTTTTVQPSYAESQPNGRGCGSKCVSATVTLPLP
jgi:hypothetical protein